MSQQSHLQEKLNDFLAGEHRVLLDKDVAKSFTSTIVKLIEAEKKQIAERLIGRLVEGVQSKDIPLQNASAVCLAKLGKLLADRDLWPTLEKLLPSLQEIYSGERLHELPAEIRQSAGSTITKTVGRNKVQKKSKPADPALPKNTMTIREEQIFRLAQTGCKDEAKRQLFDLIVSCAKKKDFANAERLRERIYEIDPMALMEIIHSGEIIEEEKIGAISPDIMQIWSKLLQVLTTEEFNDLYHSMEQRTISPEETLVTQGARNDELFFINRGCLRVSYFQIGTGGGKELFLKNLASGQIAGENFFNATVWTVSLTAVQPTNISCLKRDTLARLEKNKPGIESKLRDYYHRSSDIADLLNKRGIDRRLHDRFRKERKIHLQILGGKGKILSSFSAELSDISQGGLSFVIRITNKENIRLLLGRTIKILVPLSTGEEHKEMGTVIGVQRSDPVHSEYSVHIKFDRELDRQNLKRIIE